jgi:hypothetical protein
VVDTELDFVMHVQVDANVHHTAIVLTKAWEYKEAHINQGLLKNVKSAVFKHLIKVLHK